MAATRRAVVRQRCWASVNRIRSTVLFASTIARENLTRLANKKGRVFGSAFLAVVSNCNASSRYLLVAVFYSIPNSYRIGISTRRPLRHLWKGTRSY